MRSCILNIKCQEQSKVSEEKSRNIFDVAMLLDDTISGVCDKTSTMVNSNQPKGQLWARALNCVCSSKMKKWIFFCFFLTKKRKEIRTKKLISRMCIWIHSHWFETLNYDVVLPITFWSDKIKFANFHLCAISLTWSQFMNTCMWKRRRRRRKRRARRRQEEGECG